MLKHAADRYHSATHTCVIFTATIRICTASWLNSERVLTHFIAKAHFFLWCQTLHMECERYSFTTLKSNYTMITACAQRTFLTNVYLTSIIDFFQLLGSFTPTPLSYICSLGERKMSFLRLSFVIQVKLIFRRRSLSPKRLFNHWN